ncbi:hypothetical protein Tco_0356231 [Tanacetum coccineum]
MDAAVQQSSVAKQCLEIAKKEILLENDRLLQKIMSQDVMLTVMNSMSLNNDFVNMKKCDSCEKCLNLDADLSKSKQAYNDLLKNHSQLENIVFLSKWKEIVENIVHTPSVTTIAPGMFKLDLEPLPPSELDLACKYITRIQELLVYVQDTCPNTIPPSAKKVTIKPMNNVKKVRFVEPLLPSSRYNRHRQELGACFYLREEKCEEV